MKGEFEYIMSLGDSLSKYVGQWIATVDNKIIAFGPSAKEVFKKVKDLYPEKVPFIMKVPSDAVMVM